MLRTFSTSNVSQKTAFRLGAKVTAIITVDIRSADAYSFDRTAVASIDSVTMLPTTAPTSPGRSGCAIPGETAILSAGAWYPFTCGSSPAGPIRAG